MQSLDRAWRLIGTALSFTVFGIGGLFIGVVLFPLIHLLSAERDAAQRRCQIVVGRCFAALIWMMKSLGVLTYDWKGAERLNRHGLLVVANHPSLLDVVFIVSRMPHALCVVKSSHWRNPFVMGVMRATGYIPNHSAVQLVHDSATAIAAGKSLVIFPEGTRTDPGNPVDLKRGAASVIAASGKPFTPVLIGVSPTTLTKKEKWYDIPRSRPHWSLRVGEDVDPGPLLVDGDALSKNNRRINRILREALEDGWKYSDGTGHGGHDSRAGTEDAYHFHA